jgi:hypothetical protein
MSNQPYDKEYSLKKHNVTRADENGLLYDLETISTKPVSITSNSVTTYKKITPNITKIFYQNAGGTIPVFHIKSTSGDYNFSQQYFSLTLELRAPFINFEVSQDGKRFEDTRNPNLFSQNCSHTSIDIHNRTDERHLIPGNKGFVRYTNNSAFTTIANISYLSWKTATIAFRLQSMPVRDAFISFWVHNKHCILYLKPINGSRSMMYYNTNITTNNLTYDGVTNFTVDVGQWYHLKVVQTEVGLDISCDSFNNILSNKKYTTHILKISDRNSITTNINNGLYVQGKENCSIIIGGKGFIGYEFNTSALQFDIAWLHLFDYDISNDDVVKDCKAGWGFTEFPSAMNRHIA